MKKYLQHTLMLLVLMLTGTLGAQAAGYVRTLSSQLEVPGYMSKAFYNFQANDPAVLPTTGDLRYREGGIWGLHNFGGGTRYATVSIPVKAGDVVIIQPYTDNTATINRGTPDNSIAPGYICYKISEDANDITFTTPRYSGVVAVLVMEKDPNAPTANYTVKFVCGETEVKSETREGIVGAAINISDVDKAAYTTTEDPIQKYIYVSDDSEGKKVVADGTSVVTVTYREAATWNYTVNENAGGEAINTITGSDFEGNMIKVPFHHYILSEEGSLYEKAAINKEYNYSFTLAQADQVENLEYTLTDIADVVALKEAEDIEGLTKATSSNTAIRSSYSASAYNGTEEDVKLVHLEQGKYKIVSVAYDATSARNHSFIYKVNGEEVFTHTTAEVNYDEQTSEEFKVLPSKGADLMLAPGGGNSYAVDFFYVIKTGEIYEVSVADCQNGTLTFSPAIDKETGKIYTEEGQEVTITCKADRGYKFAGVTVKYDVEESEDETVDGQNGNDQDGQSEEIEVVEVESVEGQVEGNILEYTCTFTMPASDVTVTPVFEMLEPIDITLDAEAGNLNDQIDAIVEENDYAFVRNLTINLSEGGQYTVSNSLEASGNIIVNGAEGAEIDASALQAPFITVMTEIVENYALKDNGENSAYKVVDQVKIADVEITGLGNPIINNSGKLVYNTILVDNSVIEIVGSQNVFNLGTGYPVDLKITNSTIWSKNGHTGFFFKADGKPADVMTSGGGAYTTTTWTIDKSTIYNIAVGKKANNSNGGIKGKKTTTMVLTNSILYNFGTNAGNEVNGWCWGQNGGCNVTYKNNTYFADGTLVETWLTKGNGDATGTHLLTDPAFADAANGDFTIGEETMQAMYETGDPRWLVGVAFEYPETPNFEDLDKEIARAKNLMKAYPGLPYIGLEPAHTLQAAIDDAISRVFYSTIEFGKRSIIFQEEVPVTIEQLKAAEKAYIKRVVELEEEYAKSMAKAAPAGVDTAALTAAIDFADATLESEESTVEDLIEAYDRLKEAEKALQAATGIEEVITDETAADAPAFNLAGQRVNAKAKGIIVKNGRKYLAK